MSSFKFDQSGFKKVASDALNERVRQMQQTMDRLSRELGGQPIEMVKARLRREWRRMGGSISDPELTQYATALVEGTPINFVKQPIK